MAERAQVRVLRAFSAHAIGQRYAARIGSVLRAPADRAA
jgi:hypothetical protein